MGQVDEQVSASKVQCWRKGIRNRYPLWMYQNSTRPLSYVEAQRMLKLLIKDNAMFAFATDQGGSRFLQEHLKSASKAQLWTTFSLLKPYFLEICKDVFGNFVAQKYLELGSDAIRTEIVRTLNSSLSSLSLETYGCRVVQKLLECVEWQHKKSVARELEGSIVHFVYDENGNHVVQKIIECLESNEVAFVADEILGHAYNLAVHPYGSRIIQHLLDKVSKKKVRTLLSEIKQHTIALAKDQYGNYIIQWILENCSVERKEVVKKLKGRVAELSRQKFASNVIEQAFKCCSDGQLKMLTEELLNDTLIIRNERYPTLALLVNDQFGNYVVQTLLDSSTGPFRQRLVRSLRQCWKLNHNYGKRLLTKVDQLRLN